MILHWKHGLKERKRERERHGKEATCTGERLKETNKESRSHSLREKKERDIPPRQNAIVNCGSNCNVFVLQKSVVQLTVCFESDHTDILLPPPRAISRLSVRRCFFFSFLKPWRGQTLDFNHALYSSRRNLHSSANRRCVEGHYGHSWVSFVVHLPLCWCWDPLTLKTRNPFIVKVTDGGLNEVGSVANLHVSMPSYSKELVIQREQVTASAAKVYIPVTVSQPGYNLVPSGNEQN